MSGLASVSLLFPALVRNSCRITASICSIHACAKHLMQGKGQQSRIVGSDPSSGMIIGSCWHILFSNQIRCFAKGKDKGGAKVRKGMKPKIMLKDEEMSAVIEVQDMKDEFAAIVDGLKETYIKTLSIRSGTGIEDLPVEFDGSTYPLKELATISRKQSNLLVLNLTSMPDALKPVLEAITRSGMNVNPQQEGTVIYLQLPRVTREHREILAKNAKLLFNKAKDELAKTMNNYVRVANDKKTVNNMSSELVFNTIENIRYLEQKAVSDCEDHLNTKTKELLGE